jgi:hypothetical protein
MKKSELFNLTISALAIFLAAVSLYRQFFYSSNRLRATVTFTQIEPDSIVYDMIFVNNSTNYQAIVRADGMLSQSWDLSSSALHNKERLLEGFVIPPNELRHKSIRQSLPNEIEQPLYGGLILQMINGKGNVIIDNLTFFKLTSNENQIHKGKYQFFGRTIKDLYDVDPVDNRNENSTANGNIPRKNL